MPEPKIDLYKLHKKEYAAGRKPALITVGKARYLAIEGRGAPGTSAFTAAIGALYGIAFTAKMTRKFAGGQDYAVSKLEAQWWCEGKKNFPHAPKDLWCWKLLIRTPDSVTKTDLENAAAALRKRGKGQDTERVRLETIVEGRCVQMLHLGPYDKEAETTATMRAFAASKGLAFCGRHHEIYLSDPRRVPPQRLKTVLRMPVAAQ